MGSVFGYFTSSKPILLPRGPDSTPDGHPVTLVLADGGCSVQYAETADLG